MGVTVGKIKFDLVFKIIRKKRHKSDEKYITYPIYY